MPSSPSSALRVADLPQHKPVRFDLVPDPAQCAAIAGELNLDELRKLRFTGQIAAQGKRDWMLRDTLGATAVQPCVVTLAPVTTRIDTSVERRFVADPPAFEAGGETEMAEGDDTFEPLGSHIDPAQVMIEALALALPDYPRAPGVALTEVTATPPGAAPLTDEATRPFAGLAALKDKLQNDD